MKSVTRVVTCNGVSEITFGCFSSIACPCDQITARVGEEGIGTISRPPMIPNIEGCDLRCPLV
jgi:hypothetical protein